MMKVLKDKQADLSFALYSVTAERAEAVDFSTSYSLEPTRLYMKKGGSAFSANFYTYFQDFGWDFWLTLGMTLVLLAVIFVSLNNFEKLHVRTGRVQVLIMKV